MPLHLREIERLLEWKLQINIYYSYIYCLSGKLSNFIPLAFGEKKLVQGGMYLSVLPYA